MILSQRSSLRRTASRLARAGLPLTGALLAVTALSPAATASASTATASAGAPALRAACPPAKAGYARCFALYRVQTAVNHALAAHESGKAAKPRGLTPREIRSAYHLPVSHSQQTVAVSIAYRTPDLGAYLARYRSYFGIRPCTTRSGCLRIVNSSGKAGPLPSSGARTGWDLEATLDVSMISVACPACKILVVEAKDNATASLARTDTTAAQLGARVISNSYGTRENGEALRYYSDYSHPGRVTVAAAGDYGYTAANFPADLRSVTAVGGTELHRAPRTRRGWTERTWLVPHAAAGGSGCSAYVAKPSWQHDTACSGRTVNDVAAVAADVPIYDKLWGGWITVGGTSVAAPLIAGIYGLAGNAARIHPGYEYGRRSHLFDVTRGSNSLFVPTKAACDDDYLCVARKGYDAPTGLGTPDGAGAF